VSLNYTDVIGDRQRNVNDDDDDDDDDDAYRSLIVTLHNYYILYFAWRKM
jgi:hypothetical protein